MNRVVIAGAGTGKTYALVEAYLEKLKKYKPHEILALTFTHKAADEMRQRVILKAKQNKLFSASICTFHALCAQIVGEHFGDFELLSPEEDERLCLEIARKIIVEGHSETLLGYFRVQELANYLVQILNRIQESGLETQSIFCAEEGVLLSQMPEYLDRIERAYITFQISNLSVSTQKKFDAFGVKWEQFKKTKHQELDLSAAYREMRELLSGRFGEDESRSQLVQAVTDLGSFLCAVFTVPQAKVFKNLLQEYELKIRLVKQEKRCFGFSDLLVLSKEFLSRVLSKPPNRHGEEAPADVAIHGSMDCFSAKALRNNENVGFRKRSSVYAARYQCILVDEFQDTSPIQEQLIRILSQGKELFVVGDPKQSIYGFRGADPRIFDRVEGKRESLTLSRRSQGAVIELVNLVAEATLPGFHISQSLEALHVHQGQAGAIWRQDWALQTKKLLDSGRFRPQEIVILVRRIQAAMPMLTELRTLGVPVRMYGGEGFYERQEIADFAAALMILIEPKNALAKLTLMRSPFCELPDDAFLSWEEQTLPSIFEELRIELGKKRLAEIIDALLLKTPYVGHMAQEEDSEQRLANIYKLRLKLIAVLEDYESQIRTLWGKLDKPPRESLAEPFEIQEDAVMIMTMHQSKGLEFPAVILADLSATIPSSLDKIVWDVEMGLAVTHKNRAVAQCVPCLAPLDRVRQKIRARSEDELPRLLYVALTRAKEAVFIVDLEEADRGLSLMRLIKKSRHTQAAHFDRLMPLQ